MNALYYACIYLEGLRKTTTNLSEYIRSPGRDLNLLPPEYEAGVPTAKRRPSVTWTYLRIGPYYPNIRLECLRGQRTGSPAEIRIW
jgi:hypothetical protein